MTAYNAETRTRIVSNLRANNANLAPYTDAQVYEAWDAWSDSDDSPDESKIADWIE